MCTYIVGSHNNNNQVPQQQKAHLSLSKHSQYQETNQKACQRVKNIKKKKKRKKKKETVFRTRDACDEMLPSFNNSLVDVAGARARGDMCGSSGRGACLVVITDFPIGHYVCKYIHTYDGELANPPHVSAKACPNLMSRRE